MKNVRQKDRLDAIYFIDKKKAAESAKKKAKIEKLSNEIYYTIKGKEDTISDEGFPLLENGLSEWVLAKEVVNEKTSYYIKCDDRGQLYNPYGMYAESHLTTRSRKTGKPNYKFTNVKKRVFDLYLNFLKTKNKAWLSNAEREIL